MRIGLDPAGIPDRIVLGGGWRRAVGAERLAAAVEEAAGAATRTAVAAYSERLAGAGGLEQIEQLQAWVDGETDEPPHGVSRHPAQPSRTTAEDIASLEMAAQRQLDARPHEAVGVAAFGKVTVTVAPDGLPGGRAALVRSLPAPGATAAGTVYLVTDQGVKYPLPKDAGKVLESLGYGGAQPAGVPAAMLALIATGPTLDPEAAALPAPPATVAPPSGGRRVVGPTTLAGIEPNRLIVRVPVQQ